VATSSRQQPRRFSKDVTRHVELSYLLYLPKKYDAAPDRRWPTILFLHGAGERGDDLNAVKRHGLARVVEERDDFPFIVVSPQCPANEWWYPSLLSALLDEIEQTCRVDPDRLYVTGLSMGGFGTWGLAIAEPHRFAAIAPVCGGGQPERAAAIAHLPVWAFHGAKDQVVPLRMSEEMIDALRAHGSSARLTVYPDAGHDSWTETYNNPALYEWFLQHRRA
jgi:predicted peptidase